jgi:transcriptional regulator with XRE-family HTH domain
MAPPTPSPLGNLRRAAGISIRELERLTGINRGRLSIIERGVPPTEDEARRILAALQAEPNAPQEATP